MNDDSLRRQLLDGLRPGSSDSAELQQRVLAQWRQRHPAHELVVAGGPRVRHPLRLVGATAALLLALALTAWWQRPDPVLQELMQPDVLSQIGLGEL